MTSQCITDTDTNNLMLNGIFTTNTNGKSPNNNSMATINENIVNIKSENQFDQNPNNISTQTTDGNNNNDTASIIKTDNISSDSNNALINNHNKSNVPNQNQYKQTLEYLKELFSDRERLQLVPFGVFSHLGRLLEHEIQRVRASLIHIDGSADQRQQLVLPDPEGPIVQQSTKIYVPTDKYPDYNFIGRIIGPRGLTIRELEVDCGCKLYIRGKGSLRDKQKEEKYRGQPNWEHLSDELHVLVMVEDTENRAKLKLDRAVSQINKLFDSVISNKDDFKMRQLAELAILNDKFNPKMKQAASNSSSVLLQDNHHLSSLLTSSNAQTAGVASPISHLSCPTAAALTGASLNSASPYQTAPQTLQAFNSLFGSTATMGIDQLFTAGQLAAAASPSSAALLTGSEVPLVQFTPFATAFSQTNNISRYHPYKKK